MKILWRQSTINKICTMTFSVVLGSLLGYLMILFDLHPYLAVIIAAWVAADAAYDIGK